jgi:hypothetical protein
MTPLTKPVTRRPEVKHRQRAYSVTIAPPDVIGFREHGRRKVFWTTLGACFDMAVRQEVNAQRLAKAAKRKGRK